MLRELPSQIDPAANLAPEGPGLGGLGGSGFLGRLGGLGQIRGAGFGECVDVVSDKGLVGVGAHDDHRDGVEADLGVCELVDVVAETVDGEGLCLVAV